MPGRRTFVALAASCALAAAAPGTAQAHLLSKTRAVGAAKAAAARLARRESGDAGAPDYSAPRCTRRSRHRFVCATTVGGATACDSGELACDGPAAWELSYVITVRYGSVRSTRLTVIAQEA